MYITRHFQEARLDEVHRIIERYPFAALVVQSPAGLDATHIPFAFDAAVGTHGVLRAHVARDNPVWRECVDGADVMVMFHGGDAYVSPNWYPSKHEAHRQVPTWNYQVVHVHGKLRIHDDERYVRGVVARLTRTHEARSEQPKPWKMSDSEPAYIDQLLQNIVGLEVEIERIVGASKLSQNKEARDRQGAAEALRARGQDAVADAMQAAMMPPASA
jgi:transcriptional regulator